MRMHCDRVREEGKIGMTNCGLSIFEGFHGKALAATIHRAHLFQAMHDEVASGFTTILSCSKTSQKINEETPRKREDGGGGEGHPRQH
jgi:hypothetical protein